MSRAPVQLGRRAWEWGEVETPLQHASATIRYLRWSLDTIGYVDPLEIVGIVMPPYPPEFDEAYYELQKAFQERCREIEESFVLLYEPLFKLPVEEACDIAAALTPKQIKALPEYSEPMIEFILYGAKKVFEAPLIGYYTVFNDAFSPVVNGKSLSYFTEYHGYKRNVERALYALHLSYDLLPYVDSVFPLSIMLRSRDLWRYISDYFGREHGKNSAEA